MSRFSTVGVTAWRHMVTCGARFVRRFISIVPSSDLRGYVSEKMARASSGARMTESELCERESNGSC